MRNRGVLENKDGGVEILSAIWWGNRLRRICVMCNAESRRVGESQGFPFLLPANGPKSKRGKSNGWDRVANE